MFIANLNYIKPLEEIEKILEEHRSFLDAYYQKGKFLLSGPKEPRNGGIILCDVASEEEMNKIIAEDPFFKHNIAEYSLVQFHPVKTAEVLSQYKK